MSTGLQKVVRIQCYNTGLIGLSNISKNNINHADEHAVLLWMAGIFNDRDDISALLGNIDKITAGTVGELDGIAETLGTNNIGNMRNGGTGCSTKVQDFHARCNMNMVKTTKNTSSKLGSERIPHTVFGLGSISVLKNKPAEFSAQYIQKVSSIRASKTHLNGDSLLAVNSFAWH